MRFSGLLLLTVLVLAVIAFLFMRGRGHAGRDELTWVQEQSTPPQTYCTARTTVKDSHHVEASWNCDINLDWDAYNRFLQERLKPEYSLVSNTGSSFLYRHVAEGDSYTLTVTKVTSASSRVQLVFQAFPS